MAPHPRRRRRPRAEDCDRLVVAHLRPLLQPGDTHYQLADGTVLQLLWAPVGGACGKGGRTLGVACPQCAARVLLLRRPPNGAWGCWRCQPVSHPSHRRSGTQKGRTKPSSWHLDRIAAEQQRIVDLLGLAHWPPRRLLWCHRDLEAIPTTPTAPRLTRRRREALLRRLDALESLRLATLLPVVQQEIESLSGSGPESLPPPCWLERARTTLAQTVWAIRRQAHDPRTLRLRAALRPAPCVAGGCGLRNTR